MFPTINYNKKKNRGSSVFNENPEPSSPKVSCIGQVKVKTKKQGKKMKMLACRYRPGTEKKVIQHGSNNSNNQRWVHLPLIICNSFKCFGCNTSCFSSNDGGCCSGCCSGCGGCSGCSGCGCGGCCSGVCSGCCGVLKWMVCLGENENKTDDPLSRNKRKEVELVVSEVIDDDEDRVMERVCSRRRSIFDDVEFDDLFNNVGISSNDNNVNDNDSERSRVSICEPPKNALLLMRCKSNPMKMTSLSQKFLDSNKLVQHANDVVNVNDNDNGNDVEPPKNALLLMRCKSNPMNMTSYSQEFLDPKLVKHANVVVNEEVGVIKEVGCVKVEGLVVKDEIREVIKVESVKLEDKDEEFDDICVELDHNVDEIVVGEKIEEKQSVEEELVLHKVEETLLREGVNLDDGCSIETITDEETVEETENELEMEVKEGSEGEESSGIQYHPMTQRHLPSEELTVESKEVEVTQVRQEKVVVEEEEESVVGGESRKSMEKEKNKSMLPECLLLMMCEPKLSMEVSKETWIGRTDFLRCLPERHATKKANKTDGVDDPSSNTNSNSNSGSTKKTKAAAVAAHPPLPPLSQGGRSSIQPGRSSISFPASGGSVANLIEQKLANAGVGYEPFVLTRCKSAPLRSMAKFVPPELA